MIAEDYVRVNDESGEYEIINPFGIGIADVFCTLYMYLCGAWCILHVHKGFG